MRSPTVRNSTVVLVVEDDLFIRLAAMQLIEDLGYCAIEAGGADEAIAILEAHREITIVFTDIQMAGSMDGIELSNWAAGRWPPLKFIIVSGGIRPTTEQMPVDAVFLGKPYSSNAVERTLSSFLNAA